MKYLEILFRIITILPMFLIVTLLTDRRKISELPVFDFLLLITVGAVVGADIADPEIEHLPTAVAVIGIMLLHYIYTIVIIKSRRMVSYLHLNQLSLLRMGNL
jgi:uncharacterized membrane protein YcaP (DUF421 family)